MKFEIIEDENKEIELLKESTDIVSMAEHFEVATEMQANIAIQLKTTVKKLLTDIKDYWKEPIEQANKLHKSLTKKRNIMTDPCEKADSVISRKIKDHRLEVMRREDEARRKAEHERLKKEEDERQRLLDEAIQAEAKNKLDEVDEKLAEVEAVSIEPTYEPTKIPEMIRTEHGNLGQSKDIQVIISDEMEIIKAIARGDFPLTFVEFKLGNIKRWMKSNGIDKQNKNGVVVKPDINLRVTR